MQICTDLVLIETLLVSIVVCANGERDPTNFLLFCDLYPLAAQLIRGWQGRHFWLLIRPSRLWLPLLWRHGRTSSKGLLLCGFSPVHHCGLSVHPWKGSKMKTVRGLADLNMMAD